MSADEGRQTFVTSEGREIVRPRKKRNNRLTDRYQALLDGRLDIAELDEEELFKGMLRDTQGHLRGNHPAAIPWVMHKAYVDHVGKSLEATLIKSMPDILQSLIAIATGGGDDDRYDSGIAMDVRAKAAMYLTDRIMGRPTMKQEVDVQVHAKWEQAMEGGSLVVDLPDPDIIDAELVDEEELDSSPNPALPSPNSLVERTGDGRAPDGAESSAPTSKPQPRPRQKTGVKLR